MVQKMFAGLKFDNSYVGLPGCLYENILPIPVEAPNLIQLNEELAKELMLDAKELNSKKGAEFFSGNFIAPGSSPIALAYAGHQFGHFVPQLGDGRAVLLGEVLNKDGARFDIQLKGSGKTSFSRGGDGRAALGPIIREYIVSEAMNALGVKTTRSLAFVTTGEPVFRETVMPGGIITRIASSHIRVGTFEYLAAKDDLESIKLLADYTVNRHYPECCDEGNPYIALLKAVSNSQAKLIASWMGIGFIHGVMNTDNTSITGETIDYGPCAFMDEYDPSTVLSSIDRNGRYAYINQSNIAQWNLARLAQTLLPLLNESMKKAVEVAENIVGEFTGIYEVYWLNFMANKIGLAKPKPEDGKLIQELLNIMHQNELDFTNTFRGLNGLLDGSHSHDAAMDEWVKMWRNRLNDDGSTKKAQIELMESVNPIYIPRNHQVEKTIRAAINDEDFGVMRELIKVLNQPYKYKKTHKNYTEQPKPEEQVQETFCGT